MDWLEACIESKQKIAIRVERSSLNRTFIAHSDGRCITHAVNNPSLEITIASVDWYGYNDWMPAECVGAILKSKEARDLSEPPDPPFPLKI